MAVRMAEDIPMTEQGLAELRAELHELETVARPRMAEEIRTAREFGDLKENAEYHEAKRAQGHLETRIARLSDQLRHAVVVESSGDAAVVGFGSRVAVRDEASERESTYTLVGKTEAKASEGTLSIESPVARALVGARAGDVVTVTTPRGTRQLTVLSVAAS
jgi:transcription elongation factor GreA